MTGGGQAGGSPDAAGANRVDAEGAGRAEVDGADRAGATGADRTPPDGVTRRTVLRRAAIVTAAGVAAGTASAQEAPYGGWFTDDAPGGATGNYDGTTVDRRGQDSITITVGADGNGGTYAYAPPAVRIDPGTEVVFEWASDTHNLALQDGPDGGWGGFDEIKDADFEYTHSFETEGVYKYYCEPHVSLGMKGAIVVGDADVGGGGGGGDGGARGRPDWGGWLEGVDGGFRDARGQQEVTVTVGAQGNGGAFAFEPAGLWVDPGTTVRWEWTGQGSPHNVAAQEGYGYQSDLYSEAGVHFEYTFEDPGVSKYQCDPHVSLGMKGAVAVGDDVPTTTPAPGPTAAESGDDGGAGGILGRLPGGETASSILLAVLGITGASVALVLAGELLDALERRRERARTAVEETGGSVVAAPVTEPTRELDHESFEPRGTWTLVLVYLLILIVMWVLTYFVEFLGRGPTVIG